MIYGVRPSEKKQTEQQTAVCFSFDQTACSTVPVDDDAVSLSIKYSRNQSFSTGFIQI